MFIPNTNADFYERLPQTDNFGKHRFKPATTVRCAVIFLNSETEKSSVRADTSGSRGQAEQTQGASRFLFRKTFLPKIGDVIFKDGHWLEVIEVQQMRNVLGGHDHNQVEFRKREAVRVDGS